jgi:hypothetical protein
MFLYVRKETAMIMLRKLGATAQNSVVLEARRSGFVALRFRPSDLFRHHYFYTDDKLVAE